jgi:hypothetical protein
MGRGSENKSSVVSFQWSAAHCGLWPQPNHALGVLPADRIAQSAALRFSAGNGRQSQSCALRNPASLFGEVPGSALPEGVLCFDQWVAGWRRTASGRNQTTPWGCCQLAGLRRAQLCVLAREMDANRRAALCAIQQNLDLLNPEGNTSRWPRAPRPYTARPRRLDTPSRSVCLVNLSRQID